MNLLLIIASLLATIAVTSTSARFIQPSQLLDRDEQIDPKIRVKWHVDSVAETVSFEVIAETTGWVGFGISKSGGMLGADVVIGGVDGAVTYFEDRFSSGPSGLPSIDPQQDYDLESVVEAGGFTTLKFSRKFDTGDAERDIVIEYTGVVFIWAYGDTDKIEYHVGRRGTFPVNILEGLIIPTGSYPTTTPNYEEKDDFTRTELLATNVFVTWTVYFSLQKIIFEVEAETTGYVGFGISDSASMSNADLVIGGIYDDETPYFADRHSKLNGMPEVDISQDWDFLEARQTGNWTYLRFVRSFDTFDEEEDVEITDRNTNFIWAIGSSDDISYHRSRGSLAVNILESRIPENFERTEQIGTRISVTWHVNFVTRKVTFEVTANSTGYVGFGFSVAGTMNDADLIIGGERPDLTPYFDDRYSERAGVPSIDAQQNWDLLAVREQSNQTYLRFIRDFNTGDDIGDLPIVNKNVYFIWSLGSSDEIEYHGGDRGSFPVNILEAPSSVV